MTNIENNPQAYFEKQKLKFTTSLFEVKHMIKIISIARIIVFLITVIGIYLSVAKEYEALAIAFTTGIGFFIYLVKVHADLERKKVWNETLVKINQDELRILEGDTDDMDSGSEFLHSSHPYIEDLDIFGNRSLFQLINRTATTTGRSILADKLSNLTFNINILKSRQIAISCLRDKADWRQKFLATGKIFQEKKDDLNGLIAWANTTDVKFNTMFYRIMLIINPILGFGLLLFIELEKLSLSTFLFFLLLPLTLVGTRLGSLNKVHSQLSKKSGLLIKYAKLFSLIALENFNSALLNNIKENISDVFTAHQAVKNLAKISKSMDYRLNMLVGIFLNVFFLWDIKQAIKIEKWKNRYSVYMENWFDQLSIMDELNSFAGFAFNFPNSTFTEFSSHDFKIIATNVTHPLISQNECVGNDITIDGWKQFQIITGANMAGKSTYLRTVGVNMVLALTGSPVLADSFIMRPVGIFTGIKTTDSIQNGESYFFAELKKLKDLIDKLESGQPLFVILDEVLKGTNSADKQKGSMALITQLIKLKSSGMIATHDLALGSLAKEFPDNVTNKRFEVEIANDDLVFDFKLKNGISQNLNATFLMQKMGITI